MEDHPPSAPLEDARRRLVETGTRNRLIHVNRSARRANVLDVVGERSADVFDLLRVSGKTMRFEPAEEDETLPEAEPLLLVLSEDSEDPETREARYRDLLLETRLGPEALQRRLLRLFTDARTVEEEQGVNILYLAMGFLRWYESDNSEVMRESPLILVPVELARDDRRASFNLRARDTEIVMNLPLQERLRADFGFELPELIDEDGFAPNAYFNELTDRIAGRPRWSIDRDGMQLGFFSFSKLLMMRDLEPEHWPEDAFEAHPVLGGLLHGGFERSSPLFGPQEWLDPCLEPADLLHVVPADASQTRVIEEVRAGRNLVVQGPPGTGKSQTIANIIAAAAHDGKRVLFVAEKMAALSVVHDRLGWRFHRVWSTDWFHRRAAEIDRLRATLEAAALAEGPDYVGANRDGVLAVEEPARDDPAPETVLPPPPELTAPPYETSSFKVSVSFKPHEAPITLLSDLVTRIVQAEGPVHRDLVARRVAEAFGKSRTGKRIRDASDRALERAMLSGGVLPDGEFVMTPVQKADPPVRDRSAEGRRRARPSSRPSRSGPRRPGS